MDILRRLVSEADVYVTNHPLPMRRKLGLMYEDLEPLNPKLIYASLTAYGEDGPDKDREGFDLVAYWSRPGLMDSVRAPGAEPAQALPGMGDHPTAVALYAAIVTALLKRERTGEGSKVHTSLIANGLWSASCIAQAKFCDGDFSNWRRPDNVTLLRALYETADHRWLQLTMVRSPEELQRFLEVLALDHLLHDERFATPEARLQHGPALVTLVKARVAEQPASHWIDACGEAGVPIAMIGTLDDLKTDPQLGINRIVVQPEDPNAARFPLIMHPVNVDGAGRADIRPSPEIGQHSADILVELGYQPAQIEALRSDGVI